MNYIEILKLIDKQPKTVTDWEAKFIDSILSRNQKYLTDKQKAVVDKMAEKYLNEFKYVEYPDDPDDDIPY
jgi:hypothetical protein